MDTGGGGAGGADVTAFGIMVTVSQVYAYVKTPQTERFECQLLLYVHCISKKLKKQK